MRKFTQLFVLAFWMVGGCAAQTEPKTPASSSSPGGVATNAVIAEIKEYASIYPPAWTTYFKGETRPSKFNGKLFATIQDDGRIYIAGITPDMPIPVGKAWTHLDKRDKCGDGYVYSAWPVFTAEESRDGTRPSQWAWQAIKHNADCKPFP